MKSVLGYLNPINVVGVLKPKVKNQQMDNDPFYETINFDFANPEYLPQFDKFQPNLMEIDEYEMGSMKLNEVEEIYLSHYDILKEVKEAENNNWEYEVQHSDTVYGLELRFQIRQDFQDIFFRSMKSVLEKNQISEDLVVPGVKLKLPLSAKKNFSDSPEFQSLQLADEGAQSYLGRNLMDEIMSQKQTKKYPVYYMTNIGNIQGTLTVNEDIILFDPFFNDFNKNLSPNRLEAQILKYQACMCFKDIEKIETIVLPLRISSVGQHFFKDYIVEITLKGLGKKNRNPSRVPIATIYFKMAERQEFSESPNYKWQEQQAQLICNQVDDLLKTKNFQEEEKNTTEEDEITFIPFFENDFSDRKAITELLTNRANNIYGGSAYQPKLLQNSSILQYEQFVQVLLSQVPSVFRSGNWKLIYANHRDGSSLNTLLMDSEYNSPMLLIIKDFDGCSFGAYLSDYLRMNLGSFYGSGETFLFTFQQTPNIEVYRWSTQNQYFMYCDEDGIGVGCGDKYGIFINADLLKGYTSKCETFQNEVLNQKGQFEIDLLEVWSLDLN